MTSSYDQELSNDVHQLRKDLKAWRQAKKEEIEEKKIKPAPFVLPMHRMYTLSSEKRILCVSYRNSPKLNAAIDKAIKQKHTPKEEKQPKNEGKQPKNEEKHHSENEGQSTSQQTVRFSYNK